MTGGEGAPGSVRFKAFGPGARRRLLTGTQPMPTIRSILIRTLPAILRDVAAAYPRRQLHVGVDNYATPKPPDPCPAGRSSKGAAALHADLALLAEPGRGVLLHHHTAGTAARQLPHRRRPRRRHRALHRRYARADRLIGGRQ